MNATPGTKRTLPEHVVCTEVVADVVKEECQSVIYVGPLRMPFPSLNLALYF